MKYKLMTALSLTGIAITACLLNSQPSLSCIAMPYRGDAGGGPIASRVPPPIRLNEQRAFLWREKTTEHMMLSVKYSGGTDQFAWVIPVESRPQVTVDKGAPFSELRRLTEIRRPQLEAMAPGATASSVGSNAVTVLERKEEGPYDLAVLRASNAGGLYDWLKQNDFHVSKDAKGALDYYVTRNYVFVAARIRSGAKGNEKVAQRLAEGNIAPIHLSFTAAQLSYPLKVTSGNPGMSAMEIYVLDPDKRPHSLLKAESFKIKPVGATGFTIAGPPGSGSRGDFPTLRRLIPEGGTLTKYTASLSDSQRQEDLVFKALN